MESIKAPNPLVGKKGLYIALAVLVILVIAGGLFLWWAWYKPQPATFQPIQETEKIPETLGGQIYEEVQNPIEKIPQVNPFQAQTNPFEEAKTNPYKDVYKNPFE